MRRVALVALAALVLVAPALAGPAHAAGVIVSPSDFSPKRSTTHVSATLDVTERAGLRLATRGGRPLGWLVRPAPTRSLAVDWDGRLDGKQVVDGTYAVQLVYRTNVLAHTWVRVDTTAPHLVGLRVDNGAEPFAGDTRLLDDDQPERRLASATRANVQFTLREAATVAWK